ncbi:cupredoxin domain-containing protein [Patescibacteria group bacterium]|nr:cupredoxin domain-containing protein [Patescibacteria group bacterium]
MEELKQNKKSVEQKLSGKELYDLEKKQREETKKGERRKEKLSEAPKKISRYFFYIFIGVGVIGLFGWFIANRSNLPPMTMQGHIEQSPPSHILDKRIPENIQQHMLEHADGGGKPGIIIQYNCDKFDCETDLVERLTDLVKQYPKNVYLAPNNYDGKIILTRLGKREILDSFNEQKIRNFIEKTASSIKEISMVSGNLFFNPKDLILIKDQPVKIVFSNSGTHTFTIDELGVNVPLQGSSATVEFTPTESGTFKYYCAVPGHREGGMEGSLKVE